MGSALSTALGSWLRLQLEDTRAAFQPGQLRRHIRENVSSVRTFSAPVPRSDIYAGDPTLYLDSAHYTFGVLAKTDILRWLFIPEAELDALYRGQDANPEVPDDFEDRQFYELIGKSGGAFAKTRLLEPDANGEFPVALRQPGNRGLYIALFFSDELRTSISIYSTQAAQFNVGKLELTEAGDYTTTVSFTSIYDAGNETFIYLGPMYRVVASSGSYQGVGTEVPLEPAAHFRLPIRDSGRQSWAVRERMAKDGDGVGSVDYALSTALLQRALLPPSAQSGFDPLNGQWTVQRPRLGYLGEVFYLGARTFLVPLPPLLPVHRPSSFADYLSLSPAVPDLHLDLNPGPGLDVRLAWYRGTEVTADAFVGYHPLPEAVRLRLQQEHVNSMLERDVQRGIDLGLLRGGDGTTYSLWVFAFVRNPAILNDEPVYARRCVQHVLYEDGIMSEALHARYTHLEVSPGRANALRFSLPERVTVYRPTLAYDPQVLQGHVTRIDWSQSLKRQYRGRTGNNDGVEGDGDEDEDEDEGEGEGAWTDHYEPLYVAGHDEYRDGLFVGRAFTLPGLRLSAAREAELVAAGARSLRLQNGSVAEFVRPLGEEERVLAGQPEYVAAHVQQISLQRTIRELQQVPTPGYNVSERLVFLLVGLLEAARVQRAAYVRTVLPADGDLDEDGALDVDEVQKEKQREGERVRVRESVAGAGDGRGGATDLIEPLGALGLPDQRVRELAALDRTLASTIATVLLKYASPYYLPHLLRLQYGQLAHAPVAVVDTTMQAFLEATANLRDVYTLVDVAAQGVEVAAQGTLPSPVETLRQYVQWRNRFHVQEAYPTWLRGEGVPLVYPLYVLHLVEWSASDARTGQRYSPAEPPPWGSMVWRDRRAALTTRKAVKEQRLPHTPGYWMGGARPVHAAPLLVNTAEVLLNRVALLLSLPRSLQEEVMRRLLTEPIPLGDVYVYDEDVQEMPRIPGYVFTEDNRILKV